ncbi:MAG: tetratricopeptide repeat protein [Pyrinomonadaceae bacterium]
MTRRETMHSLDCRLDVARPLPCYVVSCVLVICLVTSIAAQRRQGVSVTATARPDGALGLNVTTRASLDSAVSALEANDLDSAERAARQAVKSAPRSPIPRNVLGVILDKKGRISEALVEINAAIKLNPKFVSARNNLGRILARNGKTGAAIAEFERVLALDPAHIQAHYNLGALYGDAGDFVKAAEHLARARSGNPNDPQLGLAFLNVAYRANRAAEAKAAADLIERQYASQPQGLFTLGTVLAQNRQYELAVRVFERANKAMPHTFEVLYNLGVALFNLDRNDEAASALAEAADIDATAPESHFRLGLIASIRNDHANAVEEFRHASERDARNATYHYMLGREYFRVGFWEGAINEYTSAINLEPKQAAYVLARANANYRKGEWTASAIDFDLAAALDPTIENIEYLQGYAQRAAGNFDRSRQLLESFLAKQPDHLDALASLGYVAIEQGRLDEAEAPLKRGLALQPNSVPILYDYARLALKRRDFAEAAARLQRVVERNPTHTQARYQLFLVYSRMKQPEKAQVELVEFKRLEALERQVKQERILDEKLRAQQMIGQGQL